MMIGSLRAVVLDVTDLPMAESYWSAVTGLEVISSKYTDRFSYLGHDDPWKHEMILQLVAEPKGTKPTGAILTSLSAVMADPFGNEFCLVSELSSEESRAAEGAIGASTDQEWRAAAGRTTALSR